MPKSSCCNGDVCFYPPKVLLRRMTAMQFFFASQTLTSTPYPSSAAGGPLAVSMDCSQWILSVERCQPKHRVVIGLATPVCFMWSVERCQPKYRVVIGLATPVSFMWSIARCQPKHRMVIGLATPVRFVWSIERCQPKHRVVIGLATRSIVPHRCRFFRKYHPSERPCFTTASPFCLRFRIPECRPVGSRGLCKSPPRC